MKFCERTYPMPYVMFRTISKALKVEAQIQPRVFSRRRSLVCGFCAKSVASVGTSSKPSSAGHIAE